MSARVLVAGAIVAASTLLGQTVAAAGGSPTCSDVLDIEVHGHHVVADYVTGSGHATFSWPPAGGVGSTVAGRGAALPGGPSHHFLREEGVFVAPGASFCNSESRSPGLHLP